MLARGRVLLVLSLAFTLAATFVADRAWAKATHKSPYTYEQAFGTSLRLLKVDLGHEVTEVNADWGYILFIYIDSESGKRKNRGAITFVKGKHEVKVSVEIPEMPSYHEELILRKLKNKLYTEHGTPPKPPEKDKNDDEGEDDEDDDKSKEDDDEGEKKKKKKKKRRSRRRG